MQPIMSGIRAYDQGKSDVMHGVNNVQTQLHRIRRQVPEIDLEIETHALEAIHRFEEASGRGQRRF